MSVEKFALPPAPEQKYLVAAHLTSTVCNLLMHGNSPDKALSICALVYSGLMHEMEREAFTKELNDLLNDLAAKDATEDK